MRRGKVTHAIAAKTQVVKLENGSILSSIPDSLKKEIRQTVSARAIKLLSSNEAKERLTCSYEGEDIEIGFNSRFFQDMLNTLETDNVALEMSAPNRAGILLPEKAENDPEDILMLIMPVMLTS